MLLPDNNNQPLTTIKFTPLHADLGLIKIDTIINVEFLLENTGENKLMIFEVKPDCNCTGYYLSSDTIAPGDTGKLSVTYNTFKKYGLQRVAIMIKANTEKRNHVLFIKAKIRR